MSAPVPSPSSPYQPFTAAQVRATQSMVSFYTRQVDMLLFRFLADDPFATDVEIDLEPPVPPHMIERLKAIYVKSGYKNVGITNHGRTLALDWSASAAAGEQEQIVEASEATDPAIPLRTAAPTTVMVEKKKATQQQQQQQQASILPMPHGKCIHEGCTRDGVYMVRNGEGGRWFCEEHRCKLCPPGTAPHKIELRSTTCRACRSKRARPDAAEAEHESETTVPAAKKPRRD